MCAAVGLACAGCIGESTPKGVATYAGRSIPACTGRDLALGAHIVINGPKVRLTYTDVAKQPCIFRRPGVPITVTLTTDKRKISPFRDQVPLSQIWGMPNFGRVADPGSFASQSAVSSLRRWCKSGSHRYTLTVSAPGAATAQATRHIC